MENTTLLEEAADLGALEPPMSSDDATGAPPPGEQDGRAAWRAIAVCIERKLEFPDWALAYLKKTAKRVEQASDTDRVKRVLDLGAPLDDSELLKDPETVFWTIQMWMALRGLSQWQGCTEYIEKVLQDKKMSEETVRKWFRKGREIAKQQMTTDEAATQAAWNLLDYEPR
jgi:hypothetical protein